MGLKSEPVCLGCGNRHVLTRASGEGSPRKHLTLLGQAGSTTTLHLLLRVETLYMGGCQNYGPSWIPVIIRHLIFRVPKEGTKMRSHQWLECRFLPNRTPSVNSKSVQREAPKTLRPKHQHAQATPCATIEFYPRLSEHPALRWLWTQSSAAEGGVSVQFTTPKHTRDPKTVPTELMVHLNGTEWGPVLSAGGLRV